MFAKKLDKQINTIILFFKQISYLLTLFFYLYHSPIKRTSFFYNFSEKEKFGSRFFSNFKLRS
jgi:hypothetical protein